MKIPGHGNAYAQRAGRAVCYMCALEVVILTQDQLRDVLMACRYGYLWARKAATLALDPAVMQFLETRARQYRAVLEQLQQALASLRWCQPGLTPGWNAPLANRYHASPATLPYWPQKEALLLCAFRDAFDAEAPAMLLGVFRVHIEHSVEALRQWPLLVSAGKGPQCR